MPTLRRGVRGLRLARMPEAERAGVDGEVLTAYDAALDSLARLGAEIVEVDLPCRFADYTALTGCIIGAEGYFLLGDLIDDMSLPIDEAVRPRIASGRGISARDYLAALRDREEAKRQFATALVDVDALLTPTTQTAAIPLDAVDQIIDAGALSPASSISSISARWHCRTASPRRDCRSRCRSSAAATTRRRPCASAGPISRRPTGTSAGRLTSSDDLKRPARSGGRGSRARRRRNGRGRRRRCCAGRLHRPASRHP